MLATSLGIAAADLILTEFLKWQEIRRRNAAYVPSASDKDEFLAYIASDSPEKIQEEVAAEEGKSWGDRQPPKTG